MIFPAITAVYAAILALFYAGLTLWVSGGRVRLGIAHGDGDNKQLHRRIRAHANFMEYVPLILILIALLEAGGVGKIVIHVLLAPLTLARLMHPIGMVARTGSPQQYIFRAPGAMITWAVMVAAAVMLLLRAV